MTERLDRAIEEVLVEYSKKEKRSKLRKRKRQFTPWKKKFFKILKYYFRFQKQVTWQILEIGKMEWDNLDEIMPNEITKFDQNQISKWSHQLAASSYYYSGKSNGSLKRHAETLKAIIGKGWSKMTRLNSEIFWNFHF